MVTKKSTKKITLSKPPYNSLTGLKKTIKNTIVTLAPVIILLLQEVPLEYAWLAGMAAYFVKNLVENSHVDVDDIKERLTKAFK